MKYFLSISLALLLLLFGGSYLYYVEGVYFKAPTASVEVWATTKDKTIQLRQDDVFAEYEIRGVNMGLGVPGHFATEYAISTDTYLRWFGQIQQMGANTVRVYTIQHPEFYEAFYKYNINNDHPLYLLHGLWVDDYVLNSHHDAYDKEFMETMKNNSKKLVDLLHGQRRVTLDDGISHQYSLDVSQWVVGYVLGVEWEGTTVAYTDNLRTDRNSYNGRYMYTTPEATPFEAMLAQVGDTIIARESARYGQQRLVAFCNWPATDPFTYPQDIRQHFKKIAEVDVEHIKTTEEFASGTFASYHIYPYYPDYLNYLAQEPLLTDEQGRINSYLTYLKAIADHHSMPVVIAEFGTPSSRGLAQRDVNTGRHQGGISETEQGKALVECYNDIMNAGCAGSIVFSWQDEWFKRTWNTLANIDLQNIAYWSDYQTNEQYFGLLSFDPGSKESICYVDGDLGEWSEQNLVTTADGVSLYAKYDEKFIYLMAKGDSVSEDSPLFIPIDVTPQSGGLAWEGNSLQFERHTDFIVTISKPAESRVLVQERYEALQASFGKIVYGVDPYEHPPAVDSNVFVPIKLLLQTPSQLDSGNMSEESVPAEAYETGKLVQGNANPKSPDYNSLADYCYGGGGIELKLPWQLLNFYNPTQMEVHDDYYLHYGIEKLRIDGIYLGVATQNTTKQPVAMTELPLNGWGHRVQYHERLKPAYYAMQSIWAVKE